MSEVPAKVDRDGAEEDKLKKGDEDLGGKQWKRWSGGQTIDLRRNPAYGRWTKPEGGK